MLANFTIFSTPVFIYLFIFFRRDEKNRRIEYRALASFPRAFWGEREVEKGEWLFRRGWTERSGWQNEWLGIRASRFSAIYRSVFSKLLEKFSRNYLSLFWFLRIDFWDFLFLVIPSNRMSVVQVHYWSFVTGLVVPN